jgi:hypothetical protein
VKSNCFSEIPLLEILICLDQVWGPGRRIALWTPRAQAPIGKLVGSSEVPSAGEDRVVLLTREYMHLLQSSMLSTASMMPPVHAGWLVPWGHEDIASLRGSESIEEETIGQ